GVLEQVDGTHARQLGTDEAHEFLPGGTPGIGRPPAVLLVEPILDLRRRRQQGAVDGAQLRRAWLALRRESEARREQQERGTAMAPGAHETPSLIGRGLAAACVA